MRKNIVAPARVETAEELLTRRVDLPIHSIHRTLVDAYGKRTWSPHGKPLMELVKTILSQNTSDHNRDLAFRRLLDLFPTWEELRDGDETEIVEAIRPGGLAQIKAPRIQSILRAITVERGDLNLEFLSSMEMEEALSWMEKFKGVGPKTAACVMLFALGKPALPVDTHVHRVSGRLGLLPPGASAHQAHRLLQAVVPSKIVYEFHVLLIEHGRKICKASSPRCSECVLDSLCQFPDKTSPKRD
jgi:endonuclease-3